MVNVATYTLTDKPSFISRLISIPLNDETPSWWPTTSTGTWAPAWTSKASTCSTTPSTCLRRPHHRHRQHRGANGRHQHHQRYSLWLHQARQDDRAGHVHPEELVPHRLPGLRQRFCPRPPAVQWAGGSGGRGAEAVGAQHRYSDELTVQPARHSVLLVHGPERHDPGQG